MVLSFWRVASSCLKLLFFLFLNYKLGRASDTINKPETKMFFSHVNTCFTQLIKGERLNQSALPSQALMWAPHEEITLINWNQPHCVQATVVVPAAQIVKILVLRIITVQHLRYVHTEIHLMGRHKCSKPRFFSLSLAGKPCRTAVPRHEFATFIHYKH